MLSQNSRLFKTFLFLLASRVTLTIHSHSNTIKTIKIYVYFIIRTHIVFLFFFLSHSQLFFHSFPEFFQYLEYFEFFNIFAMPSGWQKSFSPWTTQLKFVINFVQPFCTSITQYFYLFIWEGSRKCSVVVLWLNCSYLEYMKQIWSTFVNKFIFLTINNKPLNKVDFPINQEN